MKQLSEYIILVLWAACLLVACDNSEPTNTDHQAVPLVLQPYLVQTRASVNYSLPRYFGVEDSVRIISSAGVTADEKFYHYDSSTGRLSHKDGDDLIMVDGMDICLEWPLKDPLVPDSIPRDQSSLEKFLKADWLKALLTNVTPVFPLPVTFEHVNSKITFEFPNYSEVEEITIWSEGDNDKSGKSHYRAWCSDDIAQLMLPPGPNPLVDARTGLLVTASGKHYFMLKGLPDVLEKGKNYVITIE